MAMEPVRTDPEPHTHWPSLGWIKWHHVYFLLAGFDVLAVAFSLFLTNRLVTTHKQTVETNLRWVAWIKQTDVLAKDAGAMSTAGSDVLNSRAAAAESRKMQTALARFNETLSRLTDQISHSVSAQQAAKPLDDCASVRRQTDDLVAKCESMLSLGREGKFDKVGLLAASKNHEYDDVLRALDQLRADLRANRNRALEAQVADAEKLARFEWLLGVLIVLMVISITAYGLKLQRHMAASEAERQEKEERYRSLVENVSDVISIIDSKGVIVYENPAIKRTFGYQPDELVGRNIFDFIHPEDVVGLKSIFLKCIETHRCNHSAEYRFRHKDGSWRTIESVGTNLLELKGVQGVLVTSREITERQEMQTILRDSEQRLKEAQVAAKIGDWEHDVATGCITWSDPIYTLLERDPKLGPPDFEELLKSYHPADSARLQKLVQHAIQTGNEFSAELRMKLPSGQEARHYCAARPIRDSSGKVAKFRGIVQDVTDRKRSEESLRLQSTALEAAANAIVITDRNSDILWVNPAFTALTGYAAEEVIGKNTRVLKSGKHDDAFYQDLHETIHSGKVWHGEIINRRKDGSLYTEEMAITAVRDDQGEISRFIAIKQDITARKHAEDALRELQRQQRALLDNIPDIAWVKDKESRYVAVNEALCEAYGHRPEEIIGNTDFEMVPPELAESYRADDKHVMESRQRKRIEEPFVDAAGHRTWIETIKSPITNDQGVVIGTAGIARDITERKKAEESLRASEAGLAQSQRFAHLGSWEWDVSSGEIRWSDEVYRIFGLTPGSCQPTHQVFRNAVSSDDLEQVDKLITEALNGKGTYSIDYRIVRPDRTERNVHAEGEVAFDPSGEPLRMVGIVQDITERTRTEEALRASEEKYRGLFESMHEGFALCEIICDGAGQPCDFRYLEVNSTFEDIGIKRGDVLGKTAREVFPQIEDYWIDIYGRVALTRVPEHFENYLGVLDKHFEVAAFSPKPGQFAAIFTDITERKRAEKVLEETNQRLSNALDELKAAHKQAVQQERLSALGTMASGIAHDFNNSLVAILGFSELLLNRPDYLADKDRVHRYIEMIKVAAQDAGKVADRLREFYRHREEAEIFAPVDINRLVNEAVALTQPKWKSEAEVKGLSINIRTELHDVSPIAGNAANLREVLTNLIFNAVDAMPGGGIITIRTRRDDGHVVLEVADTGSGMTEEVRRRCLEPFFTTKGERGTGLGLSMVYGIIQRHDGTIDIQSEIGKGTTFIISLPRCATGSEVPEHEEHRSSPASSLRVLVVDDDPMVRNIISEYLKVDGHTVEIANSGRSGLEKFHSSEFDLVLVDRAMPDMSGDEVASRIKATSLHVPIVMLTGFGSMMIACDEKPTVVDLVLGKPITLSGLRVALAKLTSAAGPLEPVEAVIAR
ncbi:MAG TPA: PAS domain S-box protein [Verrucomicrobiae bacterium]|nr:PAS domain S-box protein [Verrucomicrobiae bacterium]